MCITFKGFWSFLKWVFVLHILAFTKFLLRWCAPCWLWWTLFKSTYPTLRTLCILDLKRFETFRNFCFFANFGFYEISTPMMCTMVTILNVVQIIISDIEHTVYIRFTAFWNFSKFQFVLHILAFPKFYSCDAPHANYGERCSNHHFPHCAHVVYQIYSVLKSFEIAVCFAHFGFYKISTPVMPTTLSVANIVYIIISNIAHIVCITFKAFWSFLKWVFVLNILALTKFLLRWCAPC